MDEQQISKSEPVYLRFKEARALYEDFVASCAPPHDSHFHMITYFDAFLFLYVSVEEMVSRGTKKKLNELDVFKFLKAARNVTTHHSILASPNQRNGFERPLSRHIDEGQPGNVSARFQIRPEKFREIFALAAKRFPTGQKAFEEGEKYLEILEAREDNIFIEDVMLEGLESAESLLLTEKRIEKG